METASIILLAVLGPGILFASLLTPNESVEPGTESAEVTAQASAMPNQGWAPLMIYFSAYGSHATDAQIARYEWDLDGNVQFDFDATAQGGYAKHG